MNNNVFWITRTAVMTALLVVIQYATASLGNTLVTGSFVNLILIVSVMLCGLPVGLSVAVISPVCAKLVGIGPLWSLIPFVVAGNITLILIWRAFGNAAAKKHIAALAIVCAALAKFLVLYVGIVKLAVPVLLQIPEPRASVISGAFSVPQLFTATVGGVLAVIILPFLEKAVARH